MIKVNLDEEEAINMLVNRLVEYWHPEQEVVELFAKMYENYARNGIFENMEEFDPMDIVDNDFINWCQVIEKGDEDFKKVKSIYKKYGCCDVSCKTVYSFIEAASDDESKFLVRCK